MRGRNYADIKNQVVKVDSVKALKGDRCCPYSSRVCLLEVWSVTSAGKTDEHHLMLMIGASIHLSDLTTTVLAAISGQITCHRTEDSLRGIY